MEGIGDPHSTTVLPALTTMKDDGNTSTAGSKNPRTPTNIDALPDELLSEILVRVPAEDIVERARLVCKRWCRTVHRRSFVYAHLHRTSPGLLFPRRPGQIPTFVTATQGGGIEVSQLSWGVDLLFPASCNGLILGMYYYGEKLRGLYIMNPATKSFLDLPLLSKTLSGFGIAYVAASMEYKVVTGYYPDGNPRDVQCNITTVGVDKTWRHVATQQLSPEANQLLQRDPLVTEGFMHWAFGNDVLTLNVETEVLTETPAPLAPVEYRDQGFEYSYMSTGRNLSVLFSCGKLLWEVWGLNGESTEWRKLLPNIDLKACTSKIQQFALKDDVYFTPIGWVKYPEVLLFRSNYMIGCSCVIYNLDKDEIQFIKLPSPMGNEALVHKDSLICLS